MLAECYRKGKHCQENPELAIPHLIKSAELGNEDAQFNLSVLLSEKGKVRSSLFWAIKPWEGKTIANIPVKGIIDIATRFETLNYFKEAFTFFNEAACRGNPHAIAKVIHYYEKGLGGIKDQTKETFWRQFIPKKFQTKSSLDFLKTTCSPHLATFTRPLPLPTSIKNNDRPKMLPDTSTLPESNQSYLSWFLSSFFKV